MPTSARTGLKTRISKHNKLAANLFGEPPASLKEGDDPLHHARVRLRDLTKKDEWVTETSRKVEHKGAHFSEYLGIDLPSSRPMPLVTEELARAGAYEIVLRVVWMAHYLHEICLSLVVQVEIFRRTIRRTPGAGPITQREKAKSASNMREQYQTVRLYAQQYNVFRDRMLLIEPGHLFEEAHPEYGTAESVARDEYKALEALHIRCDTKAYDTLGPNTFSLPWFWKLTSRRKDVSDESFVQDCQCSPNVSINITLTSEQFSAYVGSMRELASTEATRRLPYCRRRWA